MPRAKSGTSYLIVDPAKFNDAVIQQVEGSLAEARKINMECEDDSLLVTVPGNGLATKEKVEQVQATLSSFEYKS